MKKEEIREEIKKRNREALIIKKDAYYVAESEAAEMVILTEDRSFTLCHRLNGDRAKEESQTDKIIVFSETEVPLREEEDVIFGKSHEVITDILSNLGVEKVGYDQISQNILKKLEEEYPAEYTSQSDLIGDLRKTKTEKEIKRIKKSGQIAKRGMEKAREMSETGNTELEIAAEVEYEMRKIGSEEPAFTTVVAGGKNSRYPHFKASNKELKEGELLVVDLGAKWKNYNSDMTRTFGISPSREQRKLMEVTKRAKKEALKKLEGGTETSEIDKTVRKVFHKEGYEKYYLHSTGHGVGLSIHEPPRISPSSDETLKENMVVTVEPGLYTKKLGGCRFEDTFLVKKNGYENLTSPD